MREIRFRGMDINGCWSYGYLSEMPHGYRVEKGWYISNASGIAYAYKVRPETIGQYTGLKDKNGKDCYEGDVISVKIECQNKIIVETVYFEEYGFYPFTEQTGFLADTYSEYNFDWFEIIGNIHEGKL